MYLMPDPVANNVQSMHGDKTRWLIVSLLAAILATQVLILLRIPVSPPTIGAVQNAKTDDEANQLLLRSPVVLVQGGSIKADIIGTVDVEVQNTPLDVEVYR